MKFNINIIKDNTNTVIIDNGTDAVVFDPAMSVRDLEQYLTEKNLRLHSLYITHGHYDHMGAVPKTAAPWYMSHLDLPVIKWSNPILFAQGFGMIDAKKNPPIDIAKGEIEILPPPSPRLRGADAGLVATAISTPGHSKGSMCFLFDESRFTNHESRILITGDTLFMSSVGRMDLPGGCEDTMKNTLQKLRELNLPDDTLIIPGHGHIGTLSELKQQNHFWNNW